MLVSAIRPGTDATLTVIRDKKEISVKVTVGTNKAAQAKQAAAENESRLGVTARALTKEEEKQAETSGLLVTQVSGLAAKAGIREGDRILRVDGEKVYVMSDFSMLLSLNPGDVHDLEVLRDGKKLELNRLNMQKQDFENEDGTVSRRYGFSFTVIDASLWETLRYTALNVADCVRLVRLSLQMLITGKAGVQDVSGPVGIVQQMATVADASGSAYYAFLNLLYFGGFIAINLAVMNLLPIPALDGGRVVGVLLTALIEGITKKKLNPRIEGYIHGAGMVLLMLLMVLLLFKDLFFVIKR